MNDIIEIPLTCGQVAIVDKADYDRLPLLREKRWHAKWCRTTQGYYACAKEWIGRINGRKRMKDIRMHRLILDAPDAINVDHINGNGLDNRRRNLRLCNQGQNMMNTRRRRNAPNRFRGVSFQKSLGKWRAYINVDRRQVHLGLFTSEEDAARAYDAKAKEVYGDFARLNLAS